MPYHSIYEWKPERINALMKQAGISEMQLAENADIPEATLRTWATGKTAPTINGLIKLADYFAVPVDYLIGRTGEEVAETLVANYSQYFMQIRRASYEKYLKVTRNHMETRGYESPWPYNLADKILGKPMDKIIEEDRQKGLNYIIGQLQPKSRELLYQYYREGKTLQNIADENGITRERVRQIIAKATHILSHPAYRKYVTDGYTAASMEDDITKRRKELERVQAKLNQMETALNEKKARLHRENDEISTTPLDEIACLDTPISELNLSTRSFNCLTRSNAKTLQDVLDIARNGKLLEVQCMGRKSAMEVLRMLEQTTGERFAMYQAS